MKAVAIGAKVLLLASALLASNDGAGAATIEVADGVIEVAQDDQCSLIEALENANGDAHHSDCTAGEEGLDTVVLAAGSVYTLTSVHNDFDGLTGLPIVTTPVVLRGNRATIERSSDSGTPPFRLLYVYHPSGELTVDTLTLRNGQVPDLGDGFSYPGGAILNLRTLTVVRSAIVGNTAAAGGGIFNSGDASVSDSLVSGNAGGGIFNGGSITISHSTVGNNSGSGIGCIDSSVTVTNSTVSGNSGTGVVGEGCSLTLTNSTIADNGRGLWSEWQSVYLTNTVIARSQTQDCEINEEGLGRTEVFQGVNLIEDGSCDCTKPSCLSGDPLLGELADNGGPTPTHALLAGSIAIDKADDAECPDADQRGVPRGVDGAGDGSDDDLDGGCDIGAFEAGGFVARTLVVDPEPLDSNGNDVFEPGERVTVAPTWQNTGVITRFIAGEASGFVGPGYEIVGKDAEYGELESTDSASCRDTGICYQLEIDPAGDDRPATHWEAAFEETLSDDTVKTWTLHIGDSFTDVPRTSPFYRAIETLLHHGISAGCSNNEYCPAQAVTRAAMALFALKAEEGYFYTPRACDDDGEWFLDVPLDNPLCPWIKELARRAVVNGCGYRRYCPGAPVTRAQMAVFLLKTLEGRSYKAPPCNGVFADVPCPSGFAGWVEDLYARGVTSGCGTDPLTYCPTDPVTRGQMSIFLTKTFNLELYGP